jgi:hypothetical protein
VISNAVTVTADSPSTGIGLSFLGGIHILARVATETDSMTKQVMDWMRQALKGFFSDVA